MAIARASVGVNQTPARGAMVRTSCSPSVHRQPASRLHCADAGKIGGRRVTPDGWVCRRGEKGPWSEVAAATVVA